MKSQKDKKNQFDNVPQTAKPNTCANLKIFSTNAAGLTLGKMNSFLNFINLYTPNIICIQESHYKRKGVLRLKNYTIFEAIRNKKGGGTFIAARNEFQPKLISEYSEDFEMIVIQIKTIQSDLRLICGYGPQENISEEKRLPFYTTLETEIEKAKNAGLEFLVQMDSNCKLGCGYISGDTHPISSNGKLLSEIIDRQNIKVVNGSNISSGLFTRYRKVKKSRNVHNIEKSIIDLVLTSNKLFNQVTKMEVFENRENVLHRIIKTRNGIHRIESDHNNILTHLKINVPHPKQERTEFYNLKNKECQMKFKNITSNTNMLSSVFDSSEPLETLTKRFVKKLNGCIARSLKKVRYNPKENKKQDNMKILKEELKNGDESTEEFANIKI